jgi:hypothetical protein
MTVSYKTVDFLISHKIKITMFKKWMFWRNVENFKQLLIGRSLITTNSPYF